MIRAKFRVQSVEPMGDGFEIRLSAVTGGSEENDAFYSATPSGSLVLAIVAASVAKMFEVNKEYYLDFNPVEAAA